MKRHPDTTGPGTRAPRTALGAAALGLAALILSCTDVLPCTDCPALEGSWVLGFNEVSRSAACGQVGTPDPPGTLTFARQGARVQTRAGGVDLVGTIYDTWDVVMSGGATDPVDGGSVELGLRGRYVLNKPDAGSDGQLRGTWTVQGRRGDLTCEVVRDFTAVR